MARKAHVFIQLLPEESLETALKRFKKSVERSGVLKQFIGRMYFTSSSEKKYQRRRRRQKRLARLSLN